MSRVDEARRRAAELASRDPACGSEGVGWLKPLPLSDTARVTVDAFPREGPARSALAAAPPASGPLPDENPPADAPALSLSRRTHPRVPVCSRPETPPAAVSHKIVTGAEMSPASREQYCLLAAALHNAQV